MVITLLRQNLTVWELKLCACRLRSDLFAAAVGEIKGETIRGSQPKKEDEFNMAGVNQAFAATGFLT